MEIYKLLKGRYRTGRDGAGRSDSVTSEEGRVLTLLQLLEEVKRCYCTRFRAHSKSGWVLRLVGWRTNILHSCSNLPLLASQHRRRKLGQNSFHIAPWDVQIIKNAFDCATHLAHSNKRWMLYYCRWNCNFSWCTSTLLIIFQKCRRIYIPFLYCTVARTESWRDVDSQEVQVLFWKGWLSWACHKARKIWAVWSHHGCNSRLRISAQCSRVGVIPLIKQRIQPACPNFCPHYGTAQ